MDHLFKKTPTINLSLIFFKDDRMRNHHKTIHINEWKINKINESEIGPKCVETSNFFINIKE